MAIREQGWECPKCLRIWAPRIGACGACNDRQTLGQISFKPQRTVAPQPQWSGHWTIDSPDWTI